MNTARYEDVHEDKLRRYCPWTSVTCFLVAPTATTTTTTTNNNNTNDNDNDDNYQSQYQ